VLGDVRRDAGGLPVGHGVDDGAVTVRHQPPRGSPRRGCLSC
jgi:hypothetical protein